VAGTAAVALITAAGGSLLVAPASAATNTYSGNSTSGSIVLKKGDATYERTLANPTVSINGSVDDVTGAFTASTTFAPNYTDVFVGPFNLKLYVATSISQITPITGTIDPGTGAVAATSSMKLAITVYSTPDGTPHPTTDTKLTNPSTCFVNIDFAFTGTYDGNGGLTVADPDFVVPTFPGGTTGCNLGTDSLNQQLAGPHNSVALTFAGTIAAPTTTTTTSTTIAPSTSTTMPMETTTTAVGTLPTVTAIIPTTAVPIPTTATTQAPAVQGTGVSNGTLPRTGSSTEGPVTLALALLATGTVLVVATRRRRLA